MKKHIFGLVIFSFIVSAAAIVYGLFNVSEIVSFSVPQYVPAQKTHCKMKRETERTESDSAMVTQAVYNVKTRKLSWKLSSHTDVLHLFLENEKGVQRVHAFYTQGLSDTEQLNPFSELGKMLNRLSPKTNLYVIADSGSQYAITNQLKSPFDFDSRRAVPVTIDYGK